MLTYLQERLIRHFAPLEFEEKRHIYTVDGEKYPSVSSLVEGHADKFDEGYWLPRCAKKEGVTEHELKHKWQTINKEACDLGHETHEFLEHFDGLKTPGTPQEKAGIQYLKDTLPEYDILFKEIRMYSRKYKYAGTADLLLQHKVTGKIVLADYKTNKDLFKTFGFLRHPFGSLECHPYNKYQIQLSYYQIMLHEAGCEISERKIVYLKADGTYRVFDAIDLTAQLEQFLNSKKVSNHVAW